MWLKISLELLIRLVFWDDISTVQEAGTWMLNKTYRFYAYKRRHKIYLKTRRTNYSGRLYLTTDPNDKRENNLDFLPYCNQEWVLLKFKMQRNVVRA